MVVVTVNLVEFEMMALPVFFDKYAVEQKFRLTNYFL